MSKVEILRGLITDTMTTAVREILAVVETTVAGYEGEVLSLKRELRQYKRKLHAILQPQVHLNRIDVDGVMTLDLTSSHVTDACEVRQVQVDSENEDCSVSEKCKGENGVDCLVTTMSHEEKQLTCEESEWTSAELPTDSVLTGSAHREDLVNDVQNTKVKRRRQLPGRYRSQYTVTDADCEYYYDIGKNSDNEWKPNKNKKPRPSNVKRNRLISMDEGNDDGDDDYWTAAQNNEDEEHSAASKSENNIQKDTEQQRLNVDSCQVCGYLFRSWTMLMKHALGHLDNPKCMCGVCGQQLESSDDLKTHLDTHQKLHQCDTCGQYFITLDSLQKHVNTHSIDELKFNCLICQKVFDSNKLLKEHELHHKNHKQKRENIKLYKCEFCPMSFKYKALFDIHHRKHTGEKPYCCDLCGKSLTTYRSLSQHRLIHSGEKNYSCQQCGKSFYTAKFRKQHQKIHTVREKKHLCDLCSKTFVTRRELETHQKTHDNSHVVKCPFCEKLLKGNLDIHMRIHTGEKPFRCNECGKSFTSGTQLKNHMLVIHQNIKPLSCTVCGYKCARKHYLDSHMRTHTGHKPYKCTLCEQAFTQSHCLKSHMKSHQTKD